MAVTDWAGERIVVTGAAGFIGSHVSEALLAGGAAVVGFDNFDGFYAASVKRRNVAAVQRAAERAGGRFELVEGDVCDAAAFDAAVRGATGVVHLAAKAGVRPSIADPSGYARANVLGTSVVLERSAGAGAGRVVCASSSSVYGNNAKVPFSEDDGVEAPISPYAATKRACELLGHTHHHLHGTPVSMLRFFTVFGPRQRPDLAISLFLRRVAAGEAITMFGDGTTSRDYTYIGDIVAGVLAAYQRTPAYGYRIWNLGSDRPTTLRDLIGVIGRVVGVEPRIERGPMQAGDVARTWADVSRSGSELGYRAETGLEEGIGRQWGWWRAEGG